MKGAVVHVAALVVFLTACTPSYKRFDLVDQPLSCDEANRLVYRTLAAMRFTIGEVRPAAPGRHGAIAGSRTRTGGERQDATVTIDCGPHGVTLLASEGAGMVQQAEFKQAFHNAFIGVRNTHDRETALSQQMAAGAVPALPQRRDLQVVVQPMAGQASKLDFPFDLEAAGVLLVRIEITNLSPRG